MFALVFVALLLMAAALALWLFSRKTHQQTGLPQGRVVYSDTGAWQRNEKPLYSSRYGLSGKPDYLVREGEAIIPVELKTGPAPSYPRDGHVLQLTAYCLLVEENFRARPSHGIIKYADRQFAIDFTPEREDWLIETLDDMRDSLEDDFVPNRNHTDARRCARCGVREMCDQRLS